jgi:NADH:ubiquinone oxidoreductase subunit 6 (subunit J)
MRASTVYAVAVGVLYFVVSMGLNALRVAEHSVGRTALVAGLCAGVVYWIGPKLLPGAKR